MTILALEFSSEQRSVAVAHGNSIFETIETGGRSAAAFAMIERVLAAAKIEREEIATIAVGIGPGSYTGIRSAIAIAQGWQLARDVKLLGVSSVEAVAAQGQAEKNFGSVNVVVDAQRGEIYSARFDISKTAVREIEPLKIVSPNQVKPGDKTVVGPEATKWFPSGKIIFARAATIAKMAANRTVFISGERLEPIYLRKTEFVKSPSPRIIAAQ